MRLRGSVGVLVAAWLWLGSALYAADAEMKFNEVREVAPGVFFRYSAIGPDAARIPFGGSNNIWVVFDEYVVVIDANFPKEAGDVIQAIKKTTDKPIRYVFDTHHHGDHAYGNAVFAREGASVIAQANCARLLRLNGPKEFADAGRPPTGRKDIAESSLKVPNVVFDEKLVLDDGKQRIEFLFLGHGHTSGDAVAYLPKHKVLCTGDACVNGAYNYMGHADSASWVRALERMQALDVTLICPGHGPLAGRDLIEKQRRYFVELRQHVRAGIDADKDFADILRSLDLPWYREWTTVAASDRKENVEHVYAEMTGRIAPWDLTEEFAAFEGKSPTRASPEWTKPHRIVVPNLMPARLAELKRIAPDVEFVPVKTADEAARAAADADAVLGFCTADVIQTGKRVRWIQLGLNESDPISPLQSLRNGAALTDVRRISAPSVADHMFALLLGLSRGLNRANHLEEKAQAAKLHPRWDWLKEAQPQELHGKTLVLVGLGEAGTQIARRANAFGMRVIALDNRAQETPSFVFQLLKPERLHEVLPQADVLVLACALSPATRRLVGPEQLREMKKSAYLINVGDAELVDTNALVDALQKKQIAGAGLDSVSPAPLPDDHPLWKLPNVLVSPHLAGDSPEARDRQWRLWRENVRRFTAGEPLLCVVETF